MIGAAERREDERVQKEQMELSRRYAHLKRENNGQDSNQEKRFSCKKYLLISKIVDLKTCPRLKHLNDAFSLLFSILCSFAH